MTEVQTITRKLPAVTLGRTTYSVEEWTHSWVDALRGNKECESTTTVLTGPRGAQYHLRAFAGPDTGLRQVVSFKSGAPLRVAGNEVRVYQLGDIIEVAR